MSGMILPGIAGLRSEASSSTGTAVRPVRAAMQSASGLVAQWSGEGNATDSVGGHNGVLNGVTFTTGVVGQAFDLGTTNPGDVEVADSPAFALGAALTIEAWIKTGDVRADLVGNNQGFDFGLELAGDSPDGHLVFNSGAGFKMDTGSGVADGCWHHVAVTYDGTNVRFYRDGVLSSTIAETNPVGAGGSALRLGRPAGYRDYGGLLDEVKIYDRALSTSEVQSEATSVIRPSCGGNPPPTCSTTVTVPGTANPWLAGMPAGATDAGWDSVPADSPVLVNGLSVSGGAQFTFSASGAVDFGCCGMNGPDGSSASGTHNAGTDGRVNGIGQNIAPWNSLLGVFLDDNQPDTTPAPTVALDFSTAASRDYSTLFPGLKQPFFIGDGKTSNGATQIIIAPAGATRLFLGTKDGFGWFNNNGSFTVTVTGSCSALSPCNGSATASGVIAGWKADGNANDIAGSHNGTPAGTVNFVAGQVGQAFDFGAGAGEVDVPACSDFALGSSFTIEAWIKTTDPREDIIADGAGAGTYNGFNFGLGTVPGDDGPNGHLAFNSGNGYFVDTGCPLNDGNWHHVAVTFDGKSIKFHRDGVLSSIFADTHPVADSGAPLHIGHLAGFRDFSGLVDEAKIYNRPLTATEIANEVGLVGYWPEDGNPNDMVGANNPTATNALSFLPGQIAQGGSLQSYSNSGFGAYGYIDIADNGSLDNQQFTLSAWVKSLGPGPNDDSYGSVIIDKDQLNGSVSSALRWSATDNRFIFSFDDDRFVSPIRSTHAFPPGQFHHVIASYDGATFKLFVDGQLEGQQALAKTIVYNTAIPWTIGTVPAFLRNMGFPRTFNGLIDDVRIYNRALSSTEITGLYNACNTSVIPTTTACGAPIASGLVANWLEDGNPNDAVGTNNPSATNAISFVPGEAGQGVTFGPGGYIEIPDSANLDTPSITLAAWAQPNGAGPNSNDGAGSEIIAKDTSRMFTNLGGPQVSIGLYWKSDTSRFQLAVGKLPTVETYIPSFHSFAAGQFYHVVGTYDGTTAILYVNGVIEAAQNINGPIDYDASVPWTIGSTWAGFRNAGFPRTWNGVIDCVRIYNRALSAGDVAGLYSNCSCSAPALPAKPAAPVITGGLPADGGLLGPGTPGSPGHVSTIVTGTGHPGCTIRLTVTDLHEVGGNNNQTLMTTVDANGNWSIPLTLDDCDPVIDIVQICDGVTSDPVHRHIYVDGTPPVFTSGGPGDGTDFTNGGGSGGTATIILDGGASDPNTDHCVSNCGGVTYRWILVGGGAGGTDLLLGGGGAGGTLLNGGSGLSINLPPGDYYIEVQVCDAAGNCIKKRCHRRVYRPLALTGGLPGDEGIMGPASGYTPVGAGHFQTTVTGTGNPGCTIQMTVTDTRNPANNFTRSTTVSTSGNWSIPIDLYDCDPAIDIVQVCDGTAAGEIKRRIYVDGTPPVVGLSDGGALAGGITGGAGAIVLDAGASDGASAFMPADTLSYQWFSVDGNGNDVALACSGGPCPGVLTVNDPIGDYTFDVVVTDRAGNQTKKRCHRIVFGYPTATGTFVIGDRNAVLNNQVTFWGAQWDKLNSLSGGPAPASFKGFQAQSSTTPVTCGATWTTDPGNSPPPPGSVPAYMGVIVASSTTKSGSTITGDVAQIVIVKVDAGYSSNPGHAGTGTVVMVACTR